MHERIASEPELQAILIDARQEALDDAETALNRAVREGAAWAICFFLKTQGRRRGYSERQDVSHTVTVTRVDDLSDEELLRIATENRDI